MANLKTSKKSIRQNAKRRVHNQKIRTALKTHVKKVKVAVAEGDEEKIKTSLQSAQKYLDKAVEHGVIHKNQGARRKSRVAQLAAKATASK
jgi:small subunit ribosomal protein S20